MLQLLAALGSDFCQGAQELLVSDLTGSSLLISGEYEVDVCGFALLVRQLAVLNELSECLAIHFFALSIRAEHLLQAASRLASRSS